MILVGYSDTAKEYRLYDLDNNSVIINRDHNGRYKGRCWTFPIFPRSASEDNSREKIIDSVGEEIEEVEKEKISEENITTEVRRSERTPKPRKLMIM